jgi:hypothetical protein
MKYIITLCITLFLLSCGLSDEEKAARTCHYTYKYGNRHFLKVPFTITPHQLTYRVGDTITVTANFSNIIEDISYEKFFTIDSALFRPIVTLNRFVNETYLGKVSGPMNIIIDSIYKPKYGNGTLSKILYKDKQYWWKTKIVLRSKGRYVLNISDNSGDSEEQEGITAKSLKFEGICRYQGFLICNMIQGDAHMKELEPELIYVDKKLTADNMRSLYDLNSTGVFGSGSYSWELEGTYGFIVE